ncbi:MAG: response regulator [Bacteroidales bacterium]|jgi:DNA-binding NarL/FixJ family response regulator|nr:response regulator [Bacteroidales bacterium]
MKPISIYIVEDELLISASLKSQLKSFGYEVLGSSPQGEACLDELTELLQIGREPEIILMDIHLRGNQDGIEVAKKINEKFNSAIIFLTGQSSKEVYERSFKIKPFGYLLKPIDMEQTKMTIEIAAYQRNLEIENRIYQKELEILLEKRSQENLELMSMYQVIVDNSLIGLTIMQDEKFVFANHRAAEIFGCQLDEFLTFSKQDIIHFIYPEDQNKALSAYSLLLNCASQKFLVRVITRNETLKCMEAYIKTVEFKGKPAIHQTFMEVADSPK